MIFAATEAVRRLEDRASSDTRTTADSSRARGIAAELLAHGLTDRIVQCSISYNRRRGTLRGLHYQVAPHEEAKLVRCTVGAIFDVAVDLRPDSATYCQWVGAELTAANRTALSIPEGCAHGFVTLTDDAEVAYQISAAHAPEAARGVRWDDPAFGVEWPVVVEVINERDASVSRLRTRAGGDLTTTTPTTSAGERMLELAETLFPICRSHHR